MRYINPPNFLTPGDLVWFEISSDSISEFVIVEVLKIFGTGKIEICMLTGSHSVLIVNRSELWVRRYE